MHISGSNLVVQNSLLHGLIGPARFESLLVFISEHLLETVLFGFETLRMSTS